MKAQFPPTELALRRLRASVMIACWIIGLALMAQIAVFSLSMFTSLRIADVPVEAAQVPLVVTGELGVDAAAQGDPGKALTIYDRVFDDVTSLSSAVGVMAVLVLLGVLVAGVNLIAATTPTGSNSAISALIWGIIVGALALPLAGLMDLPWQDGVFRSYTKMIEEVERGQEGNSVLALLYARYMMQPIACLIGITILGWRFGSAVDMSLLPRRPFLDPELEAEASNIAISTLHGGRTSAALKRVVGTTGDANGSSGGNGDAAKKQPQPAESPAVIGLPRSTAPKRLI